MIVKIIILFLVLFISKKKTSQFHTYHIPIRDVQGKLSSYPNPTLPGRVG